MHMLITAGPTHEPIDAVRYIANRSSGRLGVALAAAARSGGWEVTLLLGPSTVSPPAGVVARRFESSHELAALLETEFARCDVLMMAAAVADYRPVAPSSGKLPRRGERITLELEPVPDLVAACAARKSARQRIIAFALEEPEQLAARAVEKLRSKGVDAIVANPLVTMGAEDIRATIFTASGERVQPPRVLAAAGDVLEKSEFAAWLVRWIETEGWPAA